MGRTGRAIVSVVTAWALAGGSSHGSGPMPSEPAGAEAAGGRPTLVYFGTYTDRSSRGIYVSRLDPATGRLGAPELAAEAVNPSFLAVHPSGRFLYAANEIASFEGATAGAASAYAVDPGTGRLTLLNQSSTKGAGPCYASLDRGGRHLLVANYGGGSVAVLPVAEDGRLGPASAVVQHPRGGGGGPRQAGPHAHSIDVDVSNRFALAADLGLDRVFIYRFEAGSGRLDPHQPAFVALKPGAGPRHLALHPGGRFAYVINELQMTLTAFHYDAERGVLEERQTLSTLPDGTPVASGFSGAEVLVHPSGRFLYASNRGHDTIAVFAVDGTQGTLRPIEHVGTGGHTPRAFGIDPSGRWLLAANQRSDRVVVFRIDPSTGRLVLTGQTAEVGAPVSVAFVSPDPPQDSR